MQIQIEKSTIGPKNISNQTVTAVQPKLTGQ